MKTFTFGEFTTMIDATDYDFAKCFETETLLMDEAIRGVSTDMSRSDYILAVAELYKAYFDTLFGEGAAALMFEGKTNLRLCDKAALALAEVICADETAYNDETKEAVGRFAAPKQTSKKSGRKAADRA